MRLGKKAMEALQAEVTGRLLPGNELVVAGPVALKGTSLIAKEKKKCCESIFQRDFSELQPLFTGISVQGKSLRKVLPGKKPETPELQHFWLWAKAAF